MSILSNIISLFSGAPAQEKAEPAPSAEPQAHGDCTIYPQPMREESQYRLAGRIEKQVNGETLVRTFVRADVFTTADDAVEFTLRKARQIIDQNGPSLFSDGAKTRQV